MNLKWAGALVVGHVIAVNPRRTYRQTGPQQLIAPAPVVLFGSCARWPKRDPYSTRNARNTKLGGSCPSCLGITTLSDRWEPTLPTGPANACEACLTRMTVV